MLLQSLTCHVHVSRVCCAVNLSQSNLCVAASDVCCCFMPYRNVFLAAILWCSDFSNILTFYNSMWKLCSQHVFLTCYAVPGSALYHMAGDVLLYRSSFSFALHFKSLSILHFILGRFYILRLEDCSTDK